MCKAYVDGECDNRLWITTKLDCFSSKRKDNNRAHRLSIVVHICKQVPGSCQNSADYSGK